MMSSAITMMILMTGSTKIDEATETTDAFYHGLYALPLRLAHDNHQTTQPCTAFRGVSRSRWTCESIGCCLSGVARSYMQDSTSTKASEPVITRRVLADHLTSKLTLGY
jgi:hypothetical protein